MWRWLTPAERRGAAAVALLLLLGAVWERYASRPASARHVLPGAARSHGSATGPASGAAPAEGSRPGAPSESAGRPIEINRASAADLERLPRIGPVLAARIVAHREGLGRFGRLEDLLGVRGIGPKLLERLRPLVTIAGPDSDSVGRHERAR